MRGAQEVYPQTLAVAPALASSALLKAKISSAFLTNLPMVNFSAADVTGSAELPAELFAQPVNPAHGERR